MSLREVEVIPAARGIEVSYDAIREWGLRFGRAFATTLKRRRSQPGDKWLLDEVFIRIRGKQHCLWRAIDRNGVVLDVLVLSRRNKKAAKRLFPQASERLALRRVCHRDGQAEVIRGSKEGSEDRRRTPTKPISEQRLRSLASADPAARTAHERFKSAKHAQRFPSTHSPVHNHFQLRRHLISAPEYRAARVRALTIWREVTGLALNRLNHPERSLFRPSVRQPTVRLTVPQRHITHGVAVVEVAEQLNAGLRHAAPPTAMR
ncbi:IS6 family transposase [Azospirillum sp. Vi22]|uniref:DDE-type integrase/transposase/recombinase n=1 Tax=Azospirillum baldaniorum TaxID=1064539 RepID=UPI001B3C0531|nr:DDE-type integrase/transposase/recombinase [Azospirillum baldaniorum]NUB05261.1 IS6 family transposase [Azospirillum baldaniorum]